MKYELRISNSARKQLIKLPASIQKTINVKLVKLCADPFAQGLDVKKLHGRDGYRLRIGDYRAIYELENNKLVLTVITVGHRKKIYQ